MYKKALKDLAKLNLGKAAALPINRYASDKIIRRRDEILSNLRVY